MKIPEQAEIVFEGKIFTIFQWEQELFDGSFTTFEMAKRKGSALVLPLLDNWNIILTVQEQPWKWKYIDFVWWWQEKWDTFLETAHKELLQETWYSAQNMDLIYSEDLWGSKMCYENEYYIATWIEKIAEQNLDAGERITFFEVTQEDFFALKFNFDIPLHTDMRRAVKNFSTHWPESLN